MIIRRSSVLVICFVLFFAVCRIFITPRLTHIPTWELSFEAFVHLFDGFLILVWFYDRKQQLGPSKLYAWLGWSLAFWELGWFIVERSRLK